MSKNMTCTLLVLFLVIGSPCFADDWLQFRGPNRDGISHETGLLKQWPARGPKLLWATSENLGEGYSSAAIAKQKSSSPQDLQPIMLLKPDKDGGKSVLAALQERMTVRNISAEKIPPQVLSNLLWAAFGVNRKTTSFGKPGRTAASASNSQEIDLYVAMPEGVYLYEAVPHRLTPVVSGDFRRRAGRRGAATAPVNIFYIVDLTRYDLSNRQPDRSIGDPEVQKSYYYTDTGLIAQNVYLFAASQGLVAWFHNCDKENTAKEFKLRPEQRVLFAQSVGYPVKS